MRTLVNEDIHRRARGYGIVSLLGSAPIWLENDSCHHPLLESDAEYFLSNYVTWSEIVKSTTLLIVSILIIISNVFFMFSLTVVNFTKMIPRPTLFLMISLAFCQLMTGAGVTSWGIYPTLTECWPFGRSLCQIQAVMSGALRQQTSLNLVLLALERYLAQVNFDLHLAVFSKHLTIIYIFLTWISSIGLYFIIVFVLDGFYLSTSAFSVCEPHYRSVQMLILTSCVFYFPTTMVLMYCYGTIYHSQKLKMKNRRALCSALPMLLGSSVANKPIRLSLEAETLASLVRSLSAISLTFIIMVTPWAILQVITSVTMEQPLPSIDFTVNIIFTSYNYLGPFIFWLLNPRMRRSADLALYDLSSCWASVACCSQGVVSMRDDIRGENSSNNPVLTQDCLGTETAWAEILDRTCSLNNLTVEASVKHQCCKGLN